MYKDIVKTLEALNDINVSLSNNRICKEQIENLSSGLQSDNIKIGESVEKKLISDIYSSQPSSISIEDASWIKDRLQIDLAETANNNMIEALQNSISSISNLIDNIKHVTNLKDPDLSKLEYIKEYFNRPKKKFVVSRDTLTEDIECEFIPLEIYNNMDQLSVFKSISNGNYPAENMLENIYAQPQVQFYAFLNWINKALNDTELTKNNDYNWRILFENNSISPVNMFSISESIIDGRLLDILNNLRNALQKELSYVLVNKVDALKTINLTSKTIESKQALDSFFNAGVFDKMYKDRISLMFIEFLYLSICSINKQN